MSDGPEFDYFDPTCGGEPYYLEEDTGWGQCPECNSFLENNGAESDGDGSIFDALYCPLCQERRGKANETWYDDNGEAFDDEDDWNAYGVFDDDSAAMSQ